MRRLSLSAKSPNLRGCGAGNLGTKGKTPWRPTARARARNPKPKAVLETSNSNRIIITGQAYTPMAPWGGTCLIARNTITHPHCSNKLPGRAAPLRVAGRPRERNDYLLLPLYLFVRAKAR